MARHDAVRTIDQNRIDKTKFLNAGSDLFDLPGCVRAGIFETGFELAWIFVFDGQRLHSAPHARRLKDCAAHRIAKIERIFPFLLPVSHFREFFSQLFFDPQYREKTLCHGGFLHFSRLLTAILAFFPIFFPFRGKRETETGPNRTATATTHSDANRVFRRFVK
jgi:hypothetical protein